MPALRAGSCVSRRSISAAMYARTHGDLEHTQHTLIDMRDAVGLRECLPAVASAGHAGAYNKVFRPVARFYSLTRERSAQSWRPSLELLRRQLLVRFRRSKYPNGTLGPQDWYKICIQVSNQLSGFKSLTRHTKEKVE